MVRQNFWFSWNRRWISRLTYNKVLSWVMDHWTFSMWLWYGMIFLFSLAFFISLHNKPFHGRNIYHMQTKILLICPPLVPFPLTFKNISPECNTERLRADSRTWTGGALGKKKIKLMVLNRCKFLKGYIADLMQTMEPFKHWSLNCRTNDEWKHKKKKKKLL